MYVTMNYNMYTICICNTARSKTIPFMCTHVYSYMFSTVHPPRYGPIWINTDTIFCVWKSRKGFKSETMTIPPKHMDFAKDNFARIAAAENDAENGYEAKDGDGET